MKNMKQLVI